MPIRTATLAASLLTLLLFFGPAVRADELKDIAQLVSQGQHPQALERVNSYLATRPKDIQAQFLKGVILAEQNKAAEAIRVFTTLTEQHPELPEPYNNLAVLYADQGQYDKARKALEMAIRTHPSYATAHENLGDIYAKMASDAYDKALQLDKGNARAQTKLAMVKDIFSGAARPAPGPAVKPEESVPQTAQPAPAKPDPAVKPAQPPQPSPPPPAAKPVESAKPLPAAESAKPPTDDAQTQTAALRDTVDQWAKAWASQRVDSYLAFYADSFKTPGGESRSAWEQSRRARIKAPSAISIELSDVRVTLDGERRARVSFKQHYRAGNISKRTLKTLHMKRQGSGKWLIEQELTDR